MNIFATSECPIESAQALCDTHVNKMLQESVQLLSVAHFELDVHRNYRLYLAHKIKDWAERTDKRPIVAKWTGRDKPSFYNI